MGTPSTGGSVGTPSTGGSVGSAGIFVGSTEAGAGSTGAGVGTGAGPSRHSHNTSITGGSSGHCVSGIWPAYPAPWRFPQVTLGCPGNAKITSGLPTQRSSPQTEQPVSGTAGQGSTTCRTKSESLAMGTGAGAAGARVVSTGGSVGSTGGLVGCAKVLVKSITDNVKEDW